MIKRLQNSLLFCWATIDTAVVSAMILALISVRERFRAETRVKSQSESQSAAFLADERRAIAFYRVFSRVYDSLNTYFYTDVMREEASRLASLSSWSKVLDVGCGTGYTTEAILKKSKLGEAIGIDLTRQQLKRAAENLKPRKLRLSLCRADAENLPFKNEVLDAVVSVGAVEYFPNPEVAVREMLRVTKPRGKIVVGGPEFRWFRRLYLDRVFYTPSAQELEAIFTKAGLRNVKSILTGIDTFFNTSQYVVVVVGEK